MKRLLSFLLSIFLCTCFADDVQQLYSDLKLIEEIDKDLRQDLPIIYNSIMLGGYINMPSARMNKAGTIGFSFADTPPYFIYNLNFQPFSFIELSGNYRVFIGQKESNFGNKGFGDDADRTANVKFGVQPHQYGYKYLPDIAVGFEDFYGSKRFYAPFLILTEEIPDIGLEVTIGYGKGRLKNFFAGLAWSPWRPKQLPFLKDLTLLVEYDATNYKCHPHEHPNGRSVSSRINAGLALTLRDFVQLKVSTLRGEEIAAMGSLYYNFGYTNGIFPKKDDPALYSAPQNFEPIGPLRAEKDLAKELAFAFNKQGFHLVSSYVGYSKKDEKTLWIKIINMTYWRNSDVKERVEFLLAHLMPANIDKTIVIIEENGVAIEGYVYESAYLQKFKDGKIGKPELEVLSPQIESPKLPSKYDATCVYHQRKSPWTITMRPRVLTFFGSVKGKLKYTLGWVLNPEGYLLDSVYYNVQAAYNILSSLSDVGDKDQYNPSQLLNVRTDGVNYFKTQTVTLEQAYLQKGWNMGRGFFSRVAAGYFEIAYAGIAAEILYYPIKSNLALGIQAATVLKRDYTGLGFQHKVRRLNGFTPEYEKYVGIQYFFDIYYDVKPIDLDVHIQIGQFLAKDKGARFEATKYFPSGLRFSIWYTLTNANDMVNGCVHHDKGIAFTIPFDVFLAKSSRSMIGYSMAAWLRDAGATAATGKPLFPTIESNRIY